MLCLDWVIKATKSITLWLRSWTNGSQILVQCLLLKEAWEMISTLQDLKDLGVQIERARLMTPGKFSGKTRPDCFLKMIKNNLLTRVDSGKDVRHLEFEAVSFSIVYEVGDVLEILPGQCPDAVDAFIRRCNLNPESYITVGSA